MIIKKDTNIEVTFYGKVLEDIDSTTLMEWLFDNVPNVKVTNPGYRELSSEDKKEQ